MDLRSPLAAIVVLAIWCSPISEASAQENSAAAAKTEFSSLMNIERGEIPIILSAPHGGKRGVAGAAARKGEGAKQFVTVTDVNTQRLTLALAKSLERRWGKPYVVVALFSRQYIDANRPANDAYESENAKPVYDAYHTALRESTEEVREKWGRGLLIDVHGQAAKKSTIFRGTSNGKTCSLLLERLGPDGLMGESGLLGLLHARGYAIHPAPGSNEKEDSRYNGGHIVRTYGADGRTGIDAVQLELGGDFRRLETIEKTANDLAEAVDKFAAVYFAEMRDKTKTKNATAEETGE